MPARANDLTDQLDRMQDMLDDLEIQGIERQRNLADQQHEANLDHMERQREANLDQLLQQKNIADELRLRNLDARGATSDETQSEIRQQYLRGIDLICKADLSVLPADCASKVSVAASMWDAEHAPTPAVDFPIGPVVQQSQPTSTRDAIYANQWAIVVDLARNQCGLDLSLAPISKRPVAIVRGTEETVAKWHCTNAVWSVSP